MPNISLGCDEWGLNNRPRISIQHGTCRLLAWALFGRRGQFVALISITKTGRKRSGRPFGRRGQFVAVISIIPSGRPFWDADVLSELADTFINGAHTCNLCAVVVLIF
jgi:hypothetical protein